LTELSDSHEPKKRFRRSGMILSQRKEKGSC
jgi:hypothetical protein